MVYLLTYHWNLGKHKLYNRLMDHIFLKKPCWKSPQTTIPAGNPDHLGIGKNPSPTCAHLSSSTYYDSFLLRGAPKRELSPKNLFCAKKTLGFNTFKTLVFQNPPNTFWGGVWNPKRPSQEVFGGPNIYSAGIWKTREKYGRQIGSWNPKDRGEDSKISEAPT